MEDYEWIEKIPKPLRWILFLPAVVIVYFIMRFIGSLSIGSAIGPEDDSTMSFLMYTFFYNFMCVATSLFISCLIVPKGRIIVASIYLGIILVLTGMGISTFINGEGYLYETWKIIYESFCTIGGYVVAFIIVLMHEKDLKVKASKNESL